MIAIKGMKMPGDCISCPFINAEGTKFFCSRIMKYIDKNDLESKHDDCPLVDIVTRKHCKHNYENSCDIDYQGVTDDYFCASGDIRNIPPADVIPIPDGATNGDMIKAIFPNAEYGKDILGNMFVISSAQLGYIAFRESWWNAPYKE